MSNSKIQFSNVRGCVVKNADGFYNVIVCDGAKQRARWSIIEKDLTHPFDAVSVLQELRAKIFVPDPVPSYLPESKKEANCTDDPLSQSSDLEDYYQNYYQQICANTENEFNLASQQERVEPAKLALARNRIYEHFRSGGKLHDLEKRYTYLYRRYLKKDQSFVELLGSVNAWMDKKNPYLSIKDVLSEREQKLPKNVRFGIYLAVCAQRFVPIGRLHSTVRKALMNIREKNTEFYRYLCEINPNWVSTKTTRRRAGCLRTKIYEHAKRGGQVADLTTVETNYYYYRCLYQDSSFQQLLASVNKSYDREKTKVRYSDVLNPNERRKPKNRKIGLYLAVCARLSVSKGRLEKDAYYGLDYLKETNHEIYHYLKSLNPRW